MTGIRRKSAAFGFSLLLSLIALMLTDLKTASIAAALLITANAVLFFLRKQTAYYLLVVTTAFTSAALLLTAANTWEYDPSLRLPEKNITVTGTVADYPRRTEDSQSVVLKRCVIDGEETKLSVRVYFSDGSAPLPEDTVSLTATTLSLPSGLHSRFFYHTLSNGVWLNAYARNGLQIQTKEKRSVLFAIQKLRKQVKDRFPDYMNDDLAAVSAAILTGDQSDIPPEIRDDFRKSGISHLFAVSGMHLSVWSGVIFYLLRRRSRIRVLPNLLVLCFILFYTAFTGFSPSVIRAGIMLSLMCIANMIRRHADPLNSLGAAVAGMLLFNPWLAGNVSFLLSVSATFAIVGLFPLLWNKEPPSDGAVKSMLFSKKEAVLLTVTVMFSTIPFAAYFFGYVAVLSPVTGLVCTPLAEMMMIFSAVGSLLPGGFFLTGWSYTIAAALTNAIVKITAFTGSLEFAIFPLRESYITVCFIVSAALLLLLHFRLKASRRAILHTLLALWAGALLTGIILTGTTADDYTLYLPDAGNATLITVVSGTGSRSLVLGCGGDYAAFSDAKDFLQAKTAFSPDVVAIPRNGKPENRNLRHLLREMPPTNLIVSTETEPTPQMPDQLYRTDRLDTDIFEELRLSYETTPEFCAGVMAINGQKIVFCLYPASDFSNADERYLTGDVLLCRGAIPPTLDAGRFTSVIVMTDKSGSALRLPQNAVSTADTGGYQLTVRRDPSRGKP